MNLRGGYFETVKYMTSFTLSSRASLTYDDRSFKK